MPMSTTHTPRPVTFHRLTGTTAVHNVGGAAVRMNDTEAVELPAGTGYTVERDGWMVTVILENGERGGIERDELEV